jgi:hypothetical protein
MRKFAVVLTLAASAAAARENERPVLVISAAAPGAAGGSAGLFREEGRLRYGFPRSSLRAIPPGPAHRSTRAGPS